jgi:hypothetical protein
MRVLPLVLLVLGVLSAAVVEDAAAQEDTATLWTALRAGGHVRPVTLRPVWGTAASCRRESAECGKTEKSRD